MPNDIDVAIGLQLALRRQELGLTKEQLATLVGISVEDLELHEIGSARISAELLLAFKTALQVEVSYFFQSGPSTNGKPSGQ